MVFQDESRASWMWPLSRAFFGGEKEQPSQAPRSCVPGNEDNKCAKKECERAFDIAEDLESGFARELVTDFVQPLRRSNRLWKFKVERSPNRLQYRLSGEDGVFLMYARARPDSMKTIDFHLYDPVESPHLFDENRPAFTMSANAAKTEWRIIQQHADNCQSSLHDSMRKGAGGSQHEVACIKHTRKNVGSGVNYCMDLTLPPSGFRDEKLVLQSKLPEWNEEVQSLVLDFKGRNVLASAKNFQLSPAERPDYVACQYGKISEDTFGLDFRYPLTVVQAFGVSLTTIFWT